ncbi:benzoate/H(+) symporter BenE family transporter [Deinococcus sonorensis]|uniref:Benzoate/H(+) symporter BenE family transporter n=2 Tax=Deinococcus sonorensis TaxID=309891 RepID=A0AAU7U9N5_9DEIO
MTALPAQLQSLRRDSSFSAILAGFVAVLVGFSSSIGLVFQAAQLAHLSPAQTTSWVWSVYVGIAVPGALLSWRYRAPIVTAWSTPGLALIVSEAGRLSYPEMIGSYLISAAIITALGLSGLFERLVRRIPAPLAAGLLAGLLLPFALNAFRVLPTQPVTVGSMLLAYLLGRVWLPRYAVLLALVTGVAAALAAGQVQLGSGSGVFGFPHFTAPAFTVAGLLVLALPMTLVTLASQNLPGAANLKASGYGQVPVSPLITSTGLSSFLAAPFGSHTVTLAAITAAICTGPEAHPDPQRRYVAGLANAFFYLLLGVFAGLVSGAIAALPVSLITALAGLALIGTIIASTVDALSDPRWREAAALTLIVTASGLSLLGLGSPFWGIVLGGLVGWAMNRRPR